MLEILYQDDYLIAINKPSGLLVHKSKYAGPADEYAVEKLTNQIGKKVHLVHRLDRKTSGVLLFAFDKDQFLSEHTAPFDAIVIVLDGVGQIIINKKDYELSAMEMIILPANVPHAVYGIEKFKMLLIMLKN